MDDKNNKIIAETIDIVDISILLVGDDNEQKQALELIHKHLNRQLVWKIRQLAVGLATDEVQYIYGELLISIWKSAQKKLYDLNQPLLPFLFTLAQRRTIDYIRKNTKIQEKDDCLVDDVSESLKGTKIGEVWKSIVSDENGLKMMEIFRKNIIQMPLRQRQVASIMIDHFPKELSLSELREELYKRTGEQLTIVAIKSIRREIRTKIRQQFVRAGYMEDNTDESTY